jgi:hypothetical protein
MDQAVGTEGESHEAGTTSQMKNLSPERFLVQKG